jgi:hypothetical protein
MYLSPAALRVQTNYLGMPFPSVVAIHRCPEAKQAQRGRKEISDLAAGNRRNQQRL